MKKNRAGQLVRTASRRGRPGARFQFDITVDRVLGVRAGNTYFVKWARGVKVASTKHRAANEIQVRTGLPFELEKISLLVTLYRDPESKQFDEKDSKISLVAISPSTGQERTVAKVHFNLADFAGVPSASTTKAFKLSDKVTVKTLVEARFIKSGKGGPGSAGASSALSGMTGVSGRSSDDDDPEDDFDDLNIDDIPDPEEPSKRSSSSLSAKRRDTNEGRTRRNNSSLSAGDVKGRRGTFGSAGSTDDRPAESRSKRGIFGAGNALGDAPAESRSKRGIFGGQLVSSRSKRGISAPEGVESSTSKRGLNVLRPRSKQEDSKANGGGVAPSPSRAKRDTRELDRLRADYEQMSQELRRAREKIRRSESSHQEELDALRTSLGAARGVAAADDVSISKYTARIDELEGENSRLKASLDESNRQQESLRQKAADVDKFMRKNRDLTAQLDKATAAAAAAAAADSEDSGKAVTALEERLARTRKEKELLENKIQAHKAHAEKVRETYEKLSNMYSSVREENIQLQQDLEAARAAAAAAAEAADAADRGTQKGEDSAVSTAKIAALEAQLAPLQAQVRSANARAQDADSAKVQSEAELGRVRAQVESLQMKYDKAVTELKSSKKVEEELRSETGDLKNQRDAALKRALSKRTIGIGNGAAATLTKIREESDREVSKARTRVAELEEEVQSLQEDVVYERNEKQKAREERDALRENVRGLERRTSEAALQQDSISALRRKLSTQMMREEDLNAMVGELKNEVKRLEAQSKNLRDLPSGAREENGEILGVLVKTKLELAQAEDEKLGLMFEMKQIKKSERAIQERLASHASSLEVKLGQAREEIESLRGKISPSSPVSDS